MEPLISKALPPIELNQTVCEKMLKKKYCRNTIWQVAQVLSEHKRVVILNKKKENNYPLVVFVNLKEISDDEA